MISLRKRHLQTSSKDLKHPKLLYTSSYLSERHIIACLWHLLSCRAEVCNFFLRIVLEKPLNLPPADKDLLIPSSLSCSYGRWLKKDLSVTFQFYMCRRCDAFSLSLNPWVKCCELRVLPFSQHILSCWFLRVFEFSACVCFFSCCLSFTLMENP